MIRFYLFCFLSLFTTTAFCQKIEILRRNDLQLDKSKSELFTFLDVSVDTNKLQFVATIKATIDYDNIGIEELYNSILKKAKKMGANAFRPIEYDENDTLHYITLTLETFQATDDILKLNHEKRSKNSVIIFSGEKIGNELNHLLNINNKILNFPFESYYECKIDEHSHINFSKYDYNNNINSIVWKEGKESSYFMLWGGYSVSKFNSNKVNTSLSAGYINEIDSDFGELLKVIFYPIHISESGTN